jgi:hypothetical protein
VLYGPVQDQAALWGLLNRILSSDLEVVEVRWSWSGAGC